MSATDISEMDAEEEDVFDSDFGSTDSGDDHEEDGEDAGERQLKREEKTARRVRLSFRVHLCFAGQE